MLPLPPGARIAKCNNTFASSSTLYCRRACVSRCIPSQASLSTTTAPTHQHVVRAGVQCETELWIRSDDSAAVEMPNALQQQGIGIANKAPKKASNTAAGAAVVARTEIAATAAEPHNSSLTHSSLNLLEQHGVPCGSVQSKQHQRRPMHQLHLSAQELLQPQTKLQQQQSSPVDPRTSAITQEQPDVAREYHKQVASSLRTCNSTSHLSEIIHQHGSQMDNISLTSCFSVAARLATQQQHQQQCNAGHRQPLTNSQHVNQQQQTLAGHCSTPAAQCNQQDHQHQQQQMLADTSRQADVQQFQQHSSSNSSLSQVRAVLQLQLVPLLLQKLRLLDAIGLVVVLRSLAVLKFKDENLLADLEHAAVPLASQLTPRLLSQMVWCFGQLSIAPQQQLMRQLLLHSARQLQLQRWNGQDCVQMLQGLAQVQQRPPQPWLDVYYAQVQQLLFEKQLHPTALCIILHSSAKLGCEPSSALLQQLLTEAEAMLPSLPTVGLVTLSHALLLLKRDPSPSWQQRYVEAAWGVIDGKSDARNLPLLAVPLLRWRCFPPKRWMEGFLQACSGHLDNMQVQGLAVLGHSIAGLHFLPPKPWLLHYFSAADHKALASTPAGCSYLIHTIAAWRCLEASNSSSSVGPRSSSSMGESRQPRPVAAAASGGSGAVHHAWHHWQQQQQLQLQQLQADLINQCIQCFLSHGRSFTAEQLGMFCRGLAQLGLNGNAQLSQQLHEVTYALLKQRSSKLTAATLTNVLLAVAVCCQDAATQQLMRLVWWRLQLLLHTVTPAHAAGVAWAASRLQDNDSNSSRSSSSSSSSAGSNSSSCRSRHASKVSSVSSSSNRHVVQPSEVFVQQLFQRVALTVEDASLQQLSVLLLQARRAHWQLNSSTVQFLVVELLRKQSAALKKCTCSSNSRDSMSSAAPSGGLGGTDGAAGFGSCSSSSGSSESESRLLGSANHRLKAGLQATAAAAAWADVLGPRSRMAVLRLCEKFVGGVQDSSVRSLLAGYARSVSTGRSSIEG